MILNLSACGALRQPALALELAEAGQRLDRRADVGRVRNVPPCRTNLLALVRAYAADPIAYPVELGVEIVTRERVRHVAFVVQHLFRHLAPRLRADLDAYR